MHDPCEVFSLERATGRLFWAAPPKNHAEKFGREAGYVCNGTGKNKSYWQVRFGGKTYKRSRVVFYIVHGRWPEPCVDHINSDSLDDRPENLREVTRVQNAQNQAPRRNKLSGLPQGVSAYKGKFRAKITVNKKSRFIGDFTTPAEAHAAYSQARKEYFGEYA